MIEAELKARVKDRTALVELLDQWAVGRAEVYRDTYYDTAERTLEARDAELRVRTVESAYGAARTVRTYKSAAVDEESGSKPEHETAVADPEAVHAVVRGLGYEPVIAFTKHCTNYTVTVRGRQMLATVVQVPEIDGVFVEVETMTGPEGLAGALADVRAFLPGLGIGEGDLTRELYTDAVRARRG
ncbi:class IV adenylate cyclase [Streptomyces sp. NBC_01264]|uniref:class IV adenylate cyclase n=1 Tax=Streptomyces sp. NBC_01264 TaxID=2903804 RepID=UPI00225730A4|nr:CYTH domain-containing protein [Streptomyces sp. NBC_01264]MCX4784415.1 CYTH domain-containing protein [Streptomyces sp. NBC_01264]